MFRFVSAGAGSGKTTFIIKEIEKIHLSSQKKILLITYTNSTVEELKTRIKKQNIDIHKVDICTFHSLCYQYNNQQGIFSEDNNLSLLMSFLKENYRKDFETFYSYFLSHIPVDINLYMKELENLYPEKEEVDIKKYVLEHFFTANGLFRKKPPSNIIDKIQWESDKKKLSEYFNLLNKKHNLLYLQKSLEIEKIRHQLGIFTFNHIILNILENIENFLNNIWSKYCHIFIDEVQDLSYVQFKIIEKLSEELPYHKGSSITIVGDINQSIYGFQGANPDNFYQFLEKIKNIPNLSYIHEELSKTYRFGGEIKDFVNDSFHIHKSDILEGKITLYSLVTNKETLEKQVISCLEDIQKKYPDDSILILFQKRSQLVHNLIEITEERKFKNRINPKNSLLEDFFSLVKYILTSDENSLICFLLGGFFIIPEPDFFNLWKTNKGNLFHALENQYGNWEEFITLKNLTLVKNTKDFLNIFINSKLHHNGFSFYGYQLNLILEEIEKLPNTPLLYLLEIENTSWKIERFGKIYFSTVHNSKGLEGDRVLVIDGNKDQASSSIELVNNCPFLNFFPTKDRDNPEYNNLLYVSITRAKKHLYVFGQGKEPKANSLYFFLKRFKNKKP